MTPADRISARAWLARTMLVLASALIVLVAIVFALLAVTGGSP